MDENLNPDELSLEDKIAILMADLPKPVQDFLRGPDRDRISLELTQKYSLRVDQAGAFSTAYIYMLLGVFTPEEFVSELRSAQISEEAIRGLSQDVNELVFKRLQNLERIPQPVQAPIAPVTQPPPPVYVPPTYTHPAPPTNLPTMPAMRTMAQDMQAAQGRVVNPPAPRPVQQPIAPPVAAPPASWQPTPALSFQTASIPNTGFTYGPTAASPVVPTTPTAPIPLPPSHPPIMRPPMPPGFPSREIPLAPAPPPIAPAAFPQVPPAPYASTPSPIVKEYGVDPYREMPQ